MSLFASVKRHPLHLIGGVCLATLLGLAENGSSQDPSFDRAGTKPTTGLPQSADESAPLPPSELADDSVSVSENQQLSPEDYVVPEEYREEADKADARFVELRKQLEESLGQQRALHVRFLNDVDRSKQAKEAYRKHRNESRRLMEEVYRAAIDVVQFKPDRDAIQYIMTVIEHRGKQNIYNYSTAEGGARLIQNGMPRLFLFHAAARSAVVSGEFEVARRLYEALDQEQFDEPDRALFHQIDKFEEQYREEKLIRDKEAELDNQPRVKFVTTRGEVVVELFLDSAPSTVSHFLKLVETGFYDELDFYQVMDNLLALTGDKGNGTSLQVQGPFVKDEHANPNARNAFRGSLVLAKQPIEKTGKFVPNSGNSQFAILFLPMTQVPIHQTVFGRVIEGMDVISSLRRVDPSKKKEKGEVVLPPDRILSATVIRKPDNLPEPVYVDQPGSPK